MTRNPHFWAALAALVLLAACAATPPERDARRDALAPLRDRFDAADRDGDGALDRDELAAGLPEFVADVDAIDTDRNGRISAAELRSYLEWQRILRRKPNDLREQPADMRAR
ncbi:EF-hand domain-containing protein [Fontimonas sp. SYSU GA230001]|uniref:EF-hand domain-containing protein n=1 Tax=Fontimonas sp. SYSU GA230001 TaxID=3142450 RepID=UPI0032B3A0AB